jgi:hypothetical protein
VEAVEICNLVGRKDQVRAQLLHQWEWRESS